MAKVYQVGQRIELALGQHHDVKVESLALPNPPLKRGDKGARVEQLQKALARVGALPEQMVSSTFDQNTLRALRMFQSHWAVSEDDYGPHTRAALQKALAGEGPTGERHPPPAHHGHPTPPHPAPSGGNDLRAKIVANAEWGIHNEPRIHYAETRPIPDLHNPHKLPLTTDCSGFATLCYKWAGAPDPNGLGYDGQGYTGTLLNHMHHIQPHEVEPGDLVVFGGGTGHHVCVALDKGGHWLASHGSESGPIRIGFADEHAAQKSYGASEVRWLSILHAGAAKAAAAEHKPAEHHAAKPAEHHAAKPAEHHAAKHAEHHEAKPAEHHAVKPAEHKPAPKKH